MTGALQRIGPAMLLPVVVGQLREAGDADALRLAVDVGRHAERVGPGPCPAYLVPLLERAASSAGIPAGLLVALAGVASGYDPGAASSSSAGLLAYPVADPDDQAAHLATRADLGARDPAALARLVNHAHAAARLLGELQDGPAGLPGALVEYGRMAGKAEPEARLFASSVLGAAVLGLLARVPAAGWDRAAELLGE